MIIKKTILLFSTALLVLGFQNCGPALKAKHQTVQNSADQANLTEDVDQQTLDGYEEYLAEIDISTPLTNDVERLADRPFSLADLVEIIDIFQVVYGRDPDMKEVVFWSEVFASGISIADIVIHIKEQPTSEAQSYYIVALKVYDLFEATLGRKPDMEKLLYFTKLILEGSGLEVIKALVEESRI